MEQPAMIADQGNRSILRLALGLSGLIIILAGMYAISGLVNEVLLAAFLALLLFPLSEWLQRHGLGGTWANLIVVLLVAFSVVLLIAFLAYSIAGLLSELPSYRQGIDQSAQQIQTQLAAMGITDDTVTTAVSSVSKQILGIAGAVANGIVGYSVNIVFTLLIFAFMLFDAGGFRARLQRAFSSDRPTLQRMQDSTSSVTTYVRLLTYMNLVIGIGDSILLLILGIPNPALWGFLAFVTGYIPFIGYWIAMIPVLIIAYLQGGLTTVLIVFFGYWIINGTLSNIVAPRVYGKGLNLSPVITLVAVLFWGIILGPIGAMLGAPLTAIISSVLLNSYPETKWLAILMREGDGAD